MLEKIKQLVEENFDETVYNREYLHKHPELSYQEFKTSEFIQKKLNEYGIPFTAGFVKTGIVATIEGKNPSKRIIALRADMDALPINEKNEVSYKSCNTGVMHACGHDVHSACLLGVSKVLKELSDKFEGTIKLIFQPGEEKNPGGAKLMIEEGALGEPKPDLIIGQHVYPDLKVGEVGFKEGMYMASCDELYITIKAKGGHGALPHLTPDTVLAASSMIVNMQHTISRFIPTTIPAVLTFGKFIAEGSTNVIPTEVKIAGTFRTMNEEWRAKAIQKVKDVVKSTSVSYGVDAELEVSDGYPFLINHPELTRKSKQFAQEYLGEDNVYDMELRMTSEDFSYFSQEMPGVFYRLGISGEVKSSGLHTPTFDVDKDSMKSGVGLMTWLAVKHLM